MSVFFFFLFIVVMTYAIHVQNITPDTEDKTYWIPISMFCFFLLWLSLIIEFVLKVKL